MTAMGCPCSAAGKTPQGHVGEQRFNRQKSGGAWERMSRLADGRWVRESRLIAVCRYRGCAREALKQHMLCLGKQLE
jgi:hypothetical protein